MTLLSEAPTPAARRQRRHRERKRRGVCCIGGHVPANVVHMLVKNGWLGLDEVDDPLKLGAALADLADCWARGTLEAPKP